MSLTQAMEEAYAANPAGHSIIETLEFDHVSFDQPARVAANADGDIELPPALAASAVSFTAMPVTFTPPGMAEDGPVPAKASVGNLSGYLLPYIRQAIVGTDPIRIIYRSYTTKDLTQPGEVISGLELRNVTMTAMTVEGSLSFKEIERQAFPLATYDEEYYPALQQN